MTSIPARPGTALIVIDVQEGVMAGAHDRDAVLARIVDLVERAHGTDVPVVWVQHSSQELPLESDPWQFLPELDVRDSDAVVHKLHGDSFEGTDLEEVLAAHRVGRLVVVGAQTDACVRSTIHGGFARGYDVDLVTDAHTTEDLSQWGAPTPDLVIAHTNLYWQFQSGLGKSARTVAADDVDFAAG